MAILVVDAAEGGVGAAEVAGKVAVGLLTSTSGKKSSWVTTLMARNSRSGLGLRK